MSNKNFIQKALKKHKIGALHRQLGYSMEEVIPITTLESIKRMPIGGVIHFTSGRKSIKVTRLLKRRAVFALNLRRFKR